MNYLLLILFGLAPSIIWLLYFLRKDVHPEDNRQVIKIFLYGVLVAIPAAMIQLGTFDWLSPWKDNIWKTIFIAIFGVALIEELVKYLVVRDKVLKSPHFDEPMDLPLYMIISALGFAAAENILIIAGADKNPLFAIDSLATRMALTSLCRFISATFLHALASGTLGIFMALSFFKTRNRKTRLFVGFALAVFLHGFYNLSIMTIEGSFRLLIPLIILANLAVILTIGFKKIKELKSICLPFSRN